MTAAITSNVTGFELDEQKMVVSLKVYTVIMFYCFTTFRKLTQT